MTQPKNAVLMMTIGAISLAANAAFAWVHFSKMSGKKAFTLGQEVHAEAVA